jgi:hypothetical protein
MTRSAITSVLCAILLASTAIGLREDDLAASRRTALELAGAWSNDGFRLRDSHWNGATRPGDPQVVQVNLYAGNRYWFTAAASRGTGKVSVRVFDETGAPMPVESYEDGLRAAAQFTPKNSGLHFIKVEGTGDGASDSAFTLLYSYK